MGEKANTAQPLYVDRVGGHKIITAMHRGILYFAVCEFAPFCVVREMY